ncbi:DUF3141 domain-containing protein [Janthinobacterium fluminis]|uniref:DUF3141 domain-containing protein n=1 Tax=Janthinobacterium fluminis TaxID=2987524 RepID=A0ABT5K4J0_9BURK|nr:DUF3141 domain-containing protein [Janthinobacterium fluminis]MDC8758667.1 DUF3141 domain-containing protein [Janthinobacterium fluminis]
MSNQTSGFFSPGGMPLLDAVSSYALDAWQRGVLYADVMRRRGNQYQAHLAEKTPHVLDFEADIVLSGLELARPVNYGLVRIAPADGVATDPAMRPFVVVDPRAGHGPGIGGFKAESEIGVAIRAGHPCYFVGFLPEPVPGQTVEDVMHAEAAFLEKVIALHPHSEGKPAVIANCQAGWQILMTAAMRPELFGPIVVAGAPLSYWAGWPGRNPMRYSGGLLGGSWGTALAGDLGNGRFDGASLVQNFENLNPANTLWGKKYSLYANIDTEAERYLGFEKYWGGHVFLNQVEMQYIVDNLFVGNRLATAELLTSDGVRLDLRNIRSPIVVFCSNGDNITPPPQALGWITDLYRDDTDVLTHDQTIVYAVHDSVGHLGIFVSASVGRKEHQKFASNIDLIDLLPAGIYQAEIADKTAATPNAELAGGDYVLSLKRRGIAEVRAIVQPDPASDRKFAAAARVSEINLGLYRHFMQPLVRALVTPQSARWLQSVHPLRISYECWSDRNALAPLVARQAQAIRADRRPAPPDNPLLQMQQAFSAAVVRALDGWRDLRDAAAEQTFNQIYGSPWVQALAGQHAGDGQAPRPHPGVSPEHRAFVAGAIDRLRAGIGEGGLVEAGVRALCYVHRFNGEADERRFNLALQLDEPDDTKDMDVETFRQVVRQQSRLMLLDEDGAIEALPQLLARAAPDAIRMYASGLRQMLSMPLPSSAQEQADLAKILTIFEAAALRQEPAARSQPKEHPARTA